MRVNTARSCCSAQKGGSECHWSGCQATGVMFTCGAWAKETTWWATLPLNVNGAVFTRSPDWLEVNRQDNECQSVSRSNEWTVDETRPADSNHASHMCLCLHTRPGKCVQRQQVIKTRTTCGLVVATNLLFKARKHNTTHHYCHKRTTHINLHPLNPLQDFHNKSIHQNII